MTNAEREKRLESIRRRVAFQVAAVSESERWRITAALDVAFLLSELDAALGALHDRDEERDYTRGFTAGLEEGARRERERLRPNRPHTRRLSADMLWLDLGNVADTPDA